MKIKFVLAIACAYMFGMHCANAQTSEESQTHIKLSMDVRADFTYDDTQGEDSHSGFHGRYLNMRLDGSINSKLSYSWRQRFNKFQNLGNDVFSATDWIYLRYQPVRNFAVAAGKQVLLIGGYEYDAAPIDIFFSSCFWNNIACYQFGATAEYISNDGKHSLTLQMCNSPYQSLNASCFAYNLYWSGNFGLYKTLWSVNLIEYQKGKYCNFIALGNRFDFGKFNLEADLMNRSLAHHRFINDYSVIGKAEYNVLPWLTLMAKGGYDNISINPETMEMWPGTGNMVGKPFYGGGLEFFPMHGSRDLRLHVLGYRMNDNGGVRTASFNIGLKWKVDLLKK